MKLIFSILFLISASVAACEGTRTSHPNSLDPSPLKLIPPIFFTDIEAKRAKVKLILELSKAGLVHRVEVVEVEPKSLPIKPIIEAFKEAEFVPLVREGKAINVSGFEYYWEFDIISTPKIELPPPAI